METFGSNSVKIKEHQSKISSYTDGSSNADQKWPRNDDDLMHPNRVYTAPQSSSKVLTSAFLVNYTLQLLC